jgi:hypothetical protein
MKSYIYKKYHKIPQKIRKKIEILKHINFKFPKEIKPSNKKVKKTIIVLGMHRSGTSMVSGIISKLEINLGKDMINLAKDNPRGHFENKWFVKMNDKILALAGGTWEIPPKKEKINELKQNKKLMKEIKKLVTSQESSLWGWKDPRTVLTLNLYLPYLKNPHFIVCYRDKRAIAKSLNKRNGFSIDKGINLCNTYNKRLTILLKNKKIPKLELNYENFFVNEKKEIDKISKFLGIKKGGEISLVEKKLKHF